MATKFELTAERRHEHGSGPSRRLRRLDRVPGIIYGGAKEPIMVSFDHQTLYQHLRNEAFHTSILSVKVDGEVDQAILRDLQMHPFKPKVLHLDLQRIVATEKLHMAVPIHFLNEAIAPGVKEQGGIVSHLLTEVDITCLPQDLPEFVTVDVSALNIGDSVHLSDIVLPAGVAITGLAHGGENLAVAAVVPPRSIEEEEAAAAAAAAAAEAATEAAVPGEAPPAAAPEAGAPEPAKEKDKDKDKDKDRDRAKGKS